MDMFNSLYPNTYYGEILMRGLDLQIEKIKRDLGISYIDSVLEFCKDNKFEVEEIAKKLHPSLVNKIKFEFVELNVVRGEKNDTSMRNFLDTLEDDVEIGPPIDSKLLKLLPKKRKKT